MMFTYDNALQKYLCWHLTLYLNESHCHLIQYKVLALKAMLVVNRLTDMTQITSLCRNHFLKKKYIVEPIYTSVLYRTIPFKFSKGVY